MNSIPWILISVLVHVRICTSAPPVASGRLTDIMWAICKFWNIGCDQTRRSFDRTQYLPICLHSTKKMLTLVGCCHATSFYYKRTTSKLSFQRTGKGCERLQNMKVRDKIAIRSVRIFENGNEWIVDTLLLERWNSSEVWVIISKKCPAMQTINGHPYTRNAVSENKWWSLCLLGRPQMLKACTSNLVFKWFPWYQQ